MRFSASAKRPLHVGVLLCKDMGGKVCIATHPAHLSCDHRIDGNYFATASIRSPCRTHRVFQASAVRRCAQVRIDQRGCKKGPAGHSGGRRNGGKGCKAPGFVCKKAECPGRGPRRAFRRPATLTVHSQCCAASLYKQKQALAHVVIDGVAIYFIASCGKNASSITAPSGRRSAKPAKGGEVRQLRTAWRASSPR